MTDAKTIRLTARTVSFWPMYEQRRLRMLLGQRSTWRVLGPSGGSPRQAMGEVDSMDRGSTPTKRIEPMTSLYRVGAGSGAGAADHQATALRVRRLRLHARGRVCAHE
ncbi:MAG TPA: hypothetical protein VMH50_12165, partial [Thermoleophilia bacterium]|nr:hypothetical protein [Thermoleophilia bacterium]